MSRAGLPDSVLASVLAEVVTEPGVTGDARRREIIVLGGVLIRNACLRLRQLGLVAPPSQRWPGYRPTPRGRRRMRAWLRGERPLVDLSVYDGADDRWRCAPASTCALCSGPAPPDVPVCRRCEEERGVGT